MKDSSVPIGFSMALAQNEQAVNAYAMMTKEEKEAVLEKAHKASTRRQMQKLIGSIAADQIT